jgi:hypothetical protein
MTDNNFRVSTSNYLGSDFEGYCDDVYALALSKPEQYFAIRKQVLKEVKMGAVRNLYSTFYNVLSKGEGTDEAGNPKGMSAPAGVFFRESPPSYPNQKINEFALSAAKTLSKIVDECVEILLPLDYKDIAKTRLADKSRAAGL